MFGIFQEKFDEPSIIPLRFLVNIQSLADVIGGNSGIGHPRENQVLQLIFRDHSFCFGKKIQVYRSSLNSRSSANRCAEISWRINECFGSVLCLSFRDKTFSEIKSGSIRIEKCLAKKIVSWLFFKNIQTCQGNKKVNHHVIDFLYAVPVLYSVIEQSIWLYHRS